MNIGVLFLRTFITVFGLKILKFFVADPGSGIRNKHPGSATLAAALT
jgi:hypothetical protein